MPGGGGRASLVDQLTKFVLEPGPEECSVKCRITRNCKGIDKGIYPTYFLHYEQDNGKRIFLLAGRKRKKCSTSTYVLSTDPTDLSRQGDSTLATVRSNLLGTVFSISRPNSSNFSEPPHQINFRPVYNKSLVHSFEHLIRPESGSGGSDGSSCDNGVDCHQKHKHNSSAAIDCCACPGPKIVPYFNSSFEPSSNAGSVITSLQDIGCVIYQPNILGIAGPRKMKVLLPLPSLSSMHTVISSGNGSNRCNGQVVGGQSLIDKYKNRDICDMILLNSKEASWDRKLNSYVLNFRGRANQASVKNFQLCHSHNPDIVIMQLGKVEQDVFIMDFRYPLSALQAFGIALSSFDCKLACE